MKFNVRITGIDTYARALDQLGSRVPYATARALNRGISAARTQLTRDVAKDSGLKQTTIRDRLRTQNATAQRQTAGILADAKRIPAIDFGARGPEPSRGKPGGVRSRLKSSPHRNAFIARMRSGHRGVFQRKSKPRLPIVELRGPSIAQVALNNVEGALNRGRQVFEQRLEHEVAYELRRAAKG